MTLRTKLAAFHARIHSHRHSPHHFHIGRHRSKKAKSSPSKSPARRPSKRDSLSSASTTSSGDRHSTLAPVLTLVIPTSPSHDLNIEARVYHPTEFPAEYGAHQNAPRKAAVVAHPYASLGGSWDDPVVLALVNLLVRKGWVVATFNFSGAGNSKGKTSWTGGPEREEYATIAAFVIKYVECLDPHSFTSHPTTTSSPIIPDTLNITNSSNSNSKSNNNASGTEKPPIKVLLAGYSYGSLIASRTPSADKIVKSIDSDVLAYATRTAYEWASTEKRRSFAMHRGAALGVSPWYADVYDDEEEAEASRDMSGSTTTEASKAASKVNYNIQMQLETSWLLVSPLLAPVSILLNLPNPLSWFHKGKKEDGLGNEGEKHSEADDRHMLAVYGTDDMFTGVGRYRNWAKERTEKNQTNFKAVEVEGASHFWMQEEAWMVKLREGVSSWLERSDARVTEKV